MAAIIIVLIPPIVSWTICHYYFEWNSHGKALFSWLTFFVISNALASIVSFFRGTFTFFVDNMTVSYRIKYFLLSLVIGLVWGFIYNSKISHRKSYFGSNLNLCFCAFICMSILQISLMFDSNVWLDEATTILWTKDRSLFELVRTIASSDVHPPLYYLALKITFDLFGFGLQSAKLLSFGAIFALHFFILLKAKKVSYFSESIEAGILVIVLLIATTCTQVFTYLTTEVRMYGWACFWVTVVGVEAFLFFSKMQFRDGLLLALASSFAAYTHYWAGAVSAIILFILLCFVFRYRVVVVKRYIWILVGIFFSYLPWMPYFFRQFTKVHNKFWITFQYSEINKYLEYIIGFDLKSEIFFLVFLIMFSCVALFATENIVREKINAAVFAVTAILLPYFLIAFGVALSVLFRPVFVCRYLSPTLGLFWIGVMTMVALGGKYRKLFLAVTSAIVVYTSINSYIGALHSAYETGTEETITFLKCNVGENDIISGNYGHYHDIMQYYVPEYEYIDNYDFSKINENKQLGTIWYIEDKANTTIDVNELENKGYSVSSEYSGDIDLKYRINIWKIQVR